MKRGALPSPNKLPCKDCGHRWRRGGRAHEYHHHLGYDRRQHYSVIVLCTRCHTKRDNAKAKQTHCIRGHAFDSKNTGRKPNGTRYCRECRRAWDRHRNKTTRNAAYWREYRRKRRG